MWGRSIIPWMAGVALVTGAAGFSAAAPSSHEKADDGLAERMRRSRARLWDATKNHEIVRLHNTGNWRLFEKQAYLRARITTWDALHEAVARHFAAHRKTLEREWGLEGDLLRAAFTTAIVGHLFPVGPPAGEDGALPEPRSVRAQWRMERGDGERYVPVSFYVHEARQGECNDYATMLYMLLRLAGLEARHVGPDPSHIQVEAVVDGERWLFDAMNLFFSPHSAERFHALPPEPGRPRQQIPHKTVYLLPNAGLDRTSRFFRARRGQAVLFQILTAGMSGRPTLDYPHWDRFEAFRSEDAVVSSPRK